MSNAPVRTSLSATSGELLQLVRTGQVSTRRELQEVTGLSRSTVTGRLAELAAAGYLRESGQRVGTAGRPSGVLTFSGADKLVLVADLGATHARLALMDVGGATLAEAAEELRIEAGPAQVLDDVRGCFASFLTSTRRSAEDVCGIGIGVPGPVDFGRARLDQPPIMPGWHDYPIPEAFAPHFAAPVLVDNDANLMALGEGRAAYPSAASLLFVKVGTGIGAGLVLGGRLERGAAGGAGDIGHIRIPHPLPGRRCACGSTDCLAAYASGAALARQLTERGVPASTSRDVVRLVQLGHPDAVALVRQAGGLVGQVLATAVALLNPDALVLGGDMVLTHEHFLQGVRETLYERTVARATRGLLVTASVLGDRAGVQGALAMVADRVYSAAAVDARLRER